jgi:dipeptidyl aminopeptidase/acylaminoacyl peptidase
MHEMINRWGIVAKGSDRIRGSSANDPLRMVAVPRLSAVLCLTLMLTFVGCRPKSAERRNETMVVSHTDGQEAKDGWKYSAGISEPEWSPDGRFIAFTKNLHKYVEEHKNWQGKREVWIVSENGTGTKRLKEGMKLFWERPAKLVYCHWTEQQEKPVSVAHFAAVDAKSGNVEELARKPEIPICTFRWNDTEYKVLNTKAQADRVGDQGLLNFTRDVFGEHSHAGDLDFRENMVLYSQSWQSDDAGHGIDIMYQRMDKSARPKMVVRNGSQPSLSPDGRRLAFIRDGDLWVKELTERLAGGQEPDHREQKSNEMGADDRK